jgi:biopolymer transport protein ExbD
MDIETPVALPYARAGEVEHLDRPRMVHITADGVILAGREPVSLAELADRLRENRRPVVVCADADARVLWLFYVLDACGGRPTYIAVSDGWRDAVLPVDYNRNWMVHQLLAVVPRPANSGSTAEFVLSNRLFPGGYLDDPDEAVKILNGPYKDRVEQIEEEGKEYGVDPFSVNQTTACCDLRASVSDYIRALDVLHRIGALNITAFQLRPTPWTARQHSLSRRVDHYRQLVNHYVEYESWRWTSSELPVAHIPVGADPDKGVFVTFPGDRGLIQISTDGTITWRRSARSVGDVARILDAQAALWDKKQKRSGRESREGPDKRFSTLPISFRMGRDWPWGSIRWLLTVAYNAGFYKQHLYVRTDVDLSWTREQRTVFGYGREFSEAFVVSPPPVGFNEALFEIPRPWEADAAADAFGVSLSAQADKGVGYRVGEHPVTTDVVTRNGLLEKYTGMKPVRLSVEAAVPLWRVVEIVDYLRRRGHEVALPPYEDEVPASVLAAERFPLPGN